MGINTAIIIILCNFVLIIRFRNSFEIFFSTAEAPKSIFMLNMVGKIGLTWTHNKKHWNNNENEIFKFEPNRCSYFDRNSIIVAIRMRSQFEKTNSNFKNIFIEQRGRGSWGAWWCLEARAWKSLILMTRICRPRNYVVMPRAYKPNIYK